MNRERDEKKLAVRNRVRAILVILFFSGIILLYYRMLYVEKRNSIIKSGEIAAKESADQIDQYLSTNIDSVKLAAYTLDEMIRDRRTDAEIQDYLVGQSTAVRSAVIENMTGLYGYINGRFFSGTNWEPPEDYDPTVRPWYTNAMEHPGELTILDPYVDVQSGNVMLALGKTLCDGVSVISVDVSLDRIQLLTEDAVKTGNADIEMILNDKGIVVAHSDREEIGKNYFSETDSLGAVIADRMKQADRHFEFAYHGASYVVYVAEIQNGWSCVSVMDATGVFGSLNSIMISTIVVVILIVLINSIIAARSNRYLQLSSRAIAASEAKSSFLSNMSHEIRTPINAMLGMNEMILRESEDPVILTYAGNVKSAGRSLLGLVNDILDFSRIEAGKMEILPVDYDVASVINDLLMMIHNRVEEKGLLLKQEIDPDIPRRLHGDENRVRQIIANLLTNAVKYTEVGSITFSMGFERIENDPDHILLKVSIKDTGIGIRQEDMQRLFLQFERIEEDRNRSIEGTGLGMSITKSLLELMGSDLRVESVYGEGSVFTFSLKQQVISHEPLGNPKDYTGEGKRGEECYHEKFMAPDARVLVVDDNPMNLMVFKSLVKQTCVRIDTADSGDEGIARCMDTKYDMIFLDHMMPHKDGIETLREIRDNAENPNAGAPIVCLTANAVTGARDQYLAAGFDAYLTKPIDPDKLENMMLSFLPEDKVRSREAAGAEDTEGIPEILTPLTAGPIDVKDGLKNSGAVDSYLALLKIFYESIDGNIEEINRFYQAEDFKNYTIKVHALKSSARIIGARAFGEKAQKLEDAGKAEDILYVRGHHDTFMAEYTTFKGLLSSVLAGFESDEDKPEADADFMDAVFGEIGAAAADMDCDRLDSIFDEMKDYRIPVERKTLYESIRAALEQYEYKTILSLLEKDGEGLGDSEP